MEECQALAGDRGSVSEPSQKAASAGYRAAAAHCGRAPVIPSRRSLRGEMSYRKTHTRQGHPGSTSRSVIDPFPARARRPVMRGGPVCWLAICAAPERSLCRRCWLRRVRCPCSGHSGSSNRCPHQRGRPGPLGDLPPWASPAGPAHADRHRGARRSHGPHAASHPLLTAVPAVLVRPGRGTPAGAIHVVEVPPACGNPRFLLTPGGLPSPSPALVHSRQPCSEPM